MWKASVFQTMAGMEGAPEFRKNMACWVLWQRAAATFISCPFLAYIARVPPLKRVSSSGCAETTKMDAIF